MFKRIKIKLPTYQEIDSATLRHYRGIILFVIPSIVLMSVYFPLYTFLILNGNFTMETNATTVNGILTITSIIFGLVAFEIREIKSSFLEKFLLTLPLLIYLMLTLEFVFASTVKNSMITAVSLVATMNCLFNIFYTAPVLFVKQARLELEQKKPLKEKEKSLSLLLFPSHLLKR